MDCRERRRRRLKKAKVAGSLGRGRARDMGADLVLMRRELGWGMDLILGCCARAGGLDVDALGTGSR